ncbi:MAG: GNAT family N-acetyltransferase [Candidatus Rokuibacteriota bacterium]
MRIRRVTTLREFDDLAGAWQRLTSATGQICPLVSHDWFACCWRTAGPNRRREVWVFEDAGGPVAFVPLTHSRVRMLGVPVRVVSFLGAGLAPFADIPAAGHPDDIAAAVIAELKSRRDWDILSLANLKAMSPVAKALTAVLSGELPWATSPEVATPYLTIAGTWDEFLRSRTEPVAASWCAVEAATGQPGRITVEEHREVDPDGPIFADVMEVSHAAWRDAGTMVPTAGQGEPRFLKELTRRASANGWLHLWILRVDGRAVATEYQLGANGSIHALRADHDPSSREIAAGTCLKIRIVKSLFDRGEIHEYDLPAAGDDARELASGLHETVTLDVYAPTAFGRLLHKLDTRIAPIVRRRRARLMEDHA